MFFILLALGSWNLSQTFSLSKDMVLVKEKISQIEETLDKKTFNKNKKKKKNKKKNKKEWGIYFWFIPSYFLLQSSLCMAVTMQDIELI